MNDKKKIKIVTKQSLSKIEQKKCRVCKQTFLLGQSYVSKPAGYFRQNWSTYYHAECAIEKGVIAL